MKFSPIWLLCSTGLFAIFSSTISKSPVLPLFASYLGASASEVGIIASVSAFTGIVASIPAGILSDRIGRRRMLLLSAMVFGTAPFLYLLVTELWQLAAIRFYHGLATAIFVPVAMALVADLYPGEKGQKIGLFSTATLIGRFLAPLAGGAVLGAMALSPGISYVTVYLICGAAGVAALAMAFRLPGGERSKRNPTWKETWAALPRILSNKVIVLTSTSEAGILFAYGAFETFLPLYALQSGLTIYHVGIFLAAQVITLALTKPLMGRFSDRHGRQPQIFLGAIFGAVSIGSISLFQSFAPLLVSSLLFGLSMSVVTSATSPFVADLSKKETYGSAMGVLGSIMDIGHATGPLFAGIVAGYFGAGKAFWLASFVLAVAACLFLVGVGARLGATATRA